MKDKWDARWARGPATRVPSPWLTTLDLPEKGEALDVAGGTGRHAIWMAARGLDVTLSDISSVGLEVAAREAAAAGVSIETICVDLEAEPLPVGPWDVIACFHFLHRPLFEHFAQVLKPGGVLVFVQPTVRNLERHTRPSARFLVEEGEVAGLVRGLEVEKYEEGWHENGRHEARLVARRPTS